MSTAPRPRTLRYVFARQLVTDALFCGALSAFCAIVQAANLRGAPPPAGALGLLLLAGAAFFADDFITRLFDDADRRVCYGRGLLLFWGKIVLFWLYVIGTAFVSAFAGTGAFAALIVTLSALALLAPLCFVRRLKDEAIRIFPRHVFRAADTPQSLAKEAAVALLLSAALAGTAVCLRLFAETPADCLIAGLPAACALFVFLYKVYKAVRLARRLRARRAPKGSRKDAD